MTATGTAFKYGDNVDTDVIIPARYLNSSDPAELAKHAMEDIDADYVKKIKPGDVVVAGKNFGCGSSREHAPIALKASGAACVIAKTFARIFYRNALNIGFPILECETAADGISAGDTVEVDFKAGVIRDKTTGAEYKAQPFPAFVSQMIEDGGLAERTKKKLERKKLELRG
jgi:3-isopropylmalate/(R)-2-methylmalate dehydratase small subunit